jgi:hypothetical protein
MIIMVNHMLALLIYIYEYLPFGFGACSGHLATGIGTLDTAAAVLICWVRAGRGRMKRGVSC